MASNLGWILDWRERDQYFGHKGTCTKYLFASNSVLGILPIGAQWFEIQFRWKKVHF